MPEKNLIAYYSWSGNTAKIAKLIEQKIGGKLVEIKCQEPYSSSYSAVIKRAKKEIRTGYKPPLKTTINNVDSYTRIFIGTPNWSNTIAPPVAAFLSEYDLSKITVVPFLTHGGGGQGSIVADITKLCPESKFAEEFVVYGSGAVDIESKLSDWLNALA